MSILKCYTDPDEFFPTWEDIVSFGIPCWEEKLYTEIVDSGDVIAMLNPAGLVRMEALLEGRKSHDLQHHLVEDILNHGNPAGFSCSPGESNMRIQKLKGAFSNKSAPSKDLARKVMKTEILRHLFDGGHLDIEGKDVASENVIKEGNSCLSFRLLLGKELDIPQPGKCSLYDWVTSRDKRKKAHIKPPRRHIELGVPADMWTTCRKIVTKGNNKVYRGGGFASPGVTLAIVIQIYVDDNGGNEHLVGEELVLDQNPQHQDPFLNEMELSLWRKSGQLVLVTNRLDELTPVPLLHACSKESPILCRFTEERRLVVEERQEVEKIKRHFKCVNRVEGNRFIVNPVAFSVPVGSLFSGVKFDE